MIPTGGKIAGFILMLFITIAIMIILAILSNVFVTFTYTRTTIENIYGFSAIGRSFRLVGKSLEGTGHKPAHIPDSHYN